MKRGRKVGFRESEGTKRKRSATMRGHVTSEETKKKISESMVYKARKLTKDEIDIIVRMYSECEEPLKKIAETFDISVKHIYSLVAEKKLKEEE